MGGQDGDCLGWRLPEDVEMMAVKTVAGSVGPARCRSCSVLGIVQRLQHVLVKPRETLAFGVSVSPIVQIK